MATSSFERAFKIQDDDAAKAMLDAMDNPTADDHIHKSNFEADLRRGLELLKKL
ncbi:MAG: hypothetical protein JET69_03875 [Methanomassiliicoccales archaeon]|nr:hypothetical protein [Methanomassiliicoccales archaeon]